MQADRMAEAGKAGRWAKARDIVKSKADGHPQSCFGRHATNVDGHIRVPTDGWAGRWEIRQDWEWIAFLPHRLRDLLRDQEFEPESVIQIWADRGWLMQNKGKGNHQFRVRINGNLTWTFAIRR